MYCKKGHKLTEVTDQLIMDDCFVCLDCKSVYELKYSEIDTLKPEIKEGVLKMAEIVKAREQVTIEDLKKLGHLK